MGHVVRTAGVDISTANSCKRCDTRTMGMMPFGTPASRLALLAVIVALATALAGISCLGTRSASGPMDPGVSDGQVVFGQSAVLRGPNRDLGRQMRLGIRAAFYEVNRAGGIHGRQLQLRTIDDSYETHSALHTNQWLIEKVRVFALIGAVGTPTSRVAVPLAHDAGVPFLAPLTGAEFLRDPALENVINLRASYYQEAEEMVARLTDDLGITRVAVLYQKGPCGQDGLEGVRRALARRGWSRWGPGITNAERSARRPTSSPPTPKRSS